MTEAAGEAVRVCEYRRCGAPLPPAVGRGSRARFCQDGKTWGRRGLSCRDAEAVLSDAESLREADTELDDTAVTALAGQIDRVLEPTAGLVEVLTTLRQQLEATTAAALAERDAARAESDEDRRQRGIAEAEAARARETAEDATQRARAAEKECAAAVKDRDHELTVRKAATEELQRAEGKLAAVLDELKRVTGRADAAAELAAERATVIAGLTADLGAAKTALDEERERVRAATSRAETAEARAAAIAERLEEVRAEVDRLHARQEAVRAEAERARAAFDQRLADLQAAHEQTVRSMHETATALGAELRTCTTRADDADRVLTTLRGIGDLPDAARVLLGQPVEPRPSGTAGD